MNIEGYKRNRYYLSKLINDYQPIFAFIQEHWLPDFETNVKMSKDFQNYNFLTTSSDSFTVPEDKMLESGPTWHGTALAWLKTVDSCITKIPIISERFCGVRYTDNKTNTNILAYTAYLPTSGKDDEFNEILSQLSCDIRNNLEEKCAILIGLDSNQSEKSTKRRTESMNQFNKEFSLQTILKNTEPTFHHNNQLSVSQIDHILYYVPEKSKVKVHLHKHLCQLENSDNLSSHDALVGNISLPLIYKSKKEPDYSTTYTPFVVSKPIWSECGMPGYQKQSAEVLQNIINQFNQPEFIPLMSELFSKMLVICAKNNFETITPKKMTGNLK